MKKFDVCVVGGCGLDFVYYQKADGTYSDQPDIIAPGSKGANQAVAASRAGAKVAMVSRVGNDENGRIIVENLQNNGVDTSCVEMEDGLVNDTATTRVRYEDADNEITRTTGAIKSFTPEFILRHKQTILDSKLVVAQLKVASEVTETLINLCYENNIPIIITPCHPEKLRMGENNNDELIKKITYITANRTEASTICNASDPMECVKMLPNKLIMTLGPDGVCFNDQGKLVKLDAVNCNLPIVDTTGAGDTLCGNLAAFLASGMTLKDAIAKAQYASRLKLAKKTAQAGMPYLKELNNFICDLTGREND